MKSGSQYPERAPDQLALPLLTLPLVQSLEADGWRLNAQSVTLLAKAPWQRDPGHDRDRQHCAHQ